MRNNNVQIKKVGKIMANKKNDKKEVEEKAIFSTETVDVWSDKFTTTSLKLNGVEIGMEVYNKVVDLLLKYYDGEIEA